MIGKDLYLAPLNCPGCRSRTYGLPTRFPAQNATKPDNDQNKTVLTKLSAPVYPHLARATRISGNAQLLLKVRTGWHR
jgi:hypothetical protein